MTIATFNSKGGVGKTTTTVTLARYFAHLSPLILDLDPQRAVSRYSKGLDGVTIVEASVSEFYEGSLPDAPLRFIDCPPSLDSATAALYAADLVIIPFVAEYAPTEQLVSTIQNLRSVNDSLTFRALLSRYVSNDPKQKEIRDKALGFLGENMLKTVIPHAREISYAPEYCQTVLDYAPTTRPAIAYRKLAKEIQSQFPNQFKEVA